MSGRELRPAELLELYGGRARKRFGQNFLMSDHVLEKIVDLARPIPSDRIIEIGPGPGALTASMLRRDLPVTAIEMDRDLAEHLRQTFGDDACFELIESDAMDVDIDALIASGSNKVIANLPYNVATRILFHLIDRKNPPERLVLMFQKEVAERICGPVGSRKSGWLTLGVVARYHARMGLQVPPGAFVPAPKVHSSVVVLEKRDQPLCTTEEEEVLRALADKAFGMRRKTLRNNLKGLLNDQQWEAAHVDPNKRAEALVLEDWLRLLHATNQETREKLLENYSSSLTMLNEP